MIDVDTLPIPDWGLECPHCSAPVAGRPEPRCGRCGQPFSTRALLAKKRPIPDIGLTCPTCKYALTGLMVERCPECGHTFSVRRLLDNQTWCPDFDVIGGRLHAIGLLGYDDPPDHGVIRRRPQLTGHERPLPDFGLLCAGCGGALAGAHAHACPECDRPFDLSKLTPQQEWVDITELIPRPVVGEARPVLYDAQVPYRVERKPVDAYLGEIMPTGSRLLVPRAFVFDALHAFADALPETARTEAGDWICPACEEPSPATFDVCWNCQSPRPEASNHAETPALHQCAECGDPVKGDTELCPDCRAEHEPAIGRQTEEPAEPGWRCPTCGEQAPLDFEICWRCQSPRPEQPE